MEFRLLGAIEARAGGQELDLGPAKQRCVLAVLLVHVNQVVPAEQLIARVWGGQAPHRARSTLASYLSRLRTALGPADAELARRSAGYCLLADEATVDLHRFRRLVAEADRDRPRRGELLQQALALWQGEPLTGIATAWADDLRQTLGHERLAAELDLVDARLDAGRHAALLAELLDRAEEHPWDERIGAQLMLALYRSGRHADALEHYRRLRRRLADELAADPGPEIRRLQQRMLARDPGLEPAVEPERAPARVVPRQLPADVAGFVGRVPQLTRLRELVDQGVHAIAIDGTAGVGKTALALNFGHAVADQFPDGQLHLDLRGYATTAPMTPGEALARLLRSLGVAPERIGDDPQEQAAMLRSVLAGRCVLLMLDNARTAEQVRPLLPGVPGCLALITSRAPLTTVDGLTHVPLDRLSEQDSHRLLAQSAGAARLAAEPDAAEGLVRLCARLPLALRIAGARLAARPHWSASALSRRIAEARHPLNELRAADQGVRASFDVSHDALAQSTEPVDQLAARAFRLLGVLDVVDLGLPVAATLLDVPIPDAEEALERLVDDQLLESGADGRYRGHDLLRLYATELAETHLSAEERDGALLRVFRHYVAAAARANGLLGNDNSSRLEGVVLGDPGTAHEGLDAVADVMTWIAAERANLLPLVDQAAAAPAPVPELALALVRLAHYPMDAASRWTELVALTRSAIGIAEARGDAEAAAFAANDLAWIYTRLGNDADGVTVAEQALAHYRKTGDARKIEGCLSNLAMAYWGLGEPEVAVGYCREAVDMAQAAGAPVRIASHGNTLGMIYEKLGDYPAAIEQFEETLRIVREIGHTFGEASTLNGVGWAYYLDGRLDEAITSLRQCLEIAVSTSFRSLIAFSQWGLGEIHERLGDRDEAWAWWSRSIDALLANGMITDAEADELRAQEVPETPAVVLNNV